MYKVILQNTTLAKPAIYVNMMNRACGVQNRESFVLEKHMEITSSLENGGRCVIIGTTDNKEVSFWTTQNIMHWPLMGKRIKRKAGILNGM